MDQNLLLALGLGIGLATAVGFRVFLPLLMLGLAVNAGWMNPSPDFAWVGQPAALWMFAVAAFVEIVAFYVPVLDNGLKVLATPVAIAAGIGVTAMALGDAPPMLKWTLAIIAGGGAAAAAHGATGLLRGATTVATLGLGNHLVTTGEVFSALVMTLLAFALPYLALLAAAIVVLLVLRKFFARKASG